MRAQIMRHWLISCLAAGLYALAGGMLLRHLLLGRTPTRFGRASALAVALIGAVLHAAVLYGGLRAEGALNLSFVNAFALVAWTVVLLFVLAAFYRPIHNLGVFVLPAAALAVLIAWWLPGRPVLLPAEGGLAITHIVISVIAYGLLTLAAVQGLLLLLQERQLRQRQAGALLRALPALESMEQLMFQLIGIGFVLLTLTLVSGALFSEELFGKPLRFTHHMVLALLAWVVFAVLLLGHWRLGWRGRVAARWTLGGFALLALAYFGSKFVLEILLGRA